MVWRGRWEGGSGWGTHVHSWWILVDVWQNQNNIVKLKKKKKNVILLMGIIGQCTLWLPDVP